MVDAKLTEAGAESKQPITLLLAGDVMTGRGIDQILPHPGNPSIYERYVSSALEYVALAERAHGLIPRHASFDYIWGDARHEFERRHPDLTLVNLETAITARGSPEPKGINYRMHPANTGVFTAGRICACTLANNHVLDWGSQGLLDTLDSLRASDIAVVGAGRNLREAAAPLILPLKDGKRVIVYAFGCRESGIPAHWSALPNKPGINLLRSLTPASASGIAEAIHPLKRSGDVVIASIHWGGNWGYDIPDAHRRFAHALIDEAMVDIVHGHSSHHPKAIEVYHDRLILYGCGDLIDDYEGIAGHELFRSDLAMTYFASVSSEGKLLSLEMPAFRVHKFQLQAAGCHDVDWLAVMLTREGASFRTRADVKSANVLRLAWE